MNKTRASAELEVEILGKKFIVRCAPEEREPLLEAAVLLQNRLEEAQAKAPSVERLTLQVALEIAYDYLQIFKSSQKEWGPWRERVESLRKAIEEALEHR